jgi:hypothetical protein
MSYNLAAVCIRIHSKLYQDFHKHYDNNYNYKNENLKDFTISYINTKLPTCVRIYYHKNKYYNKSLKYKSNELLTIVNYYLINDISQIILDYACDPFINNMLYYDYIGDYSPDDLLIVMKKYLILDINHIILDYTFDTSLNGNFSKYKCYLKLQFK